MWKRPCFKSATEVDNNYLPLVIYLRIILSAPISCWVLNSPYWTVKKTQTSYNVMLKSAWILKAYLSTWIEREMVLPSYTNFYPFSPIITLTIMHLRVTVFIKMQISRRIVKYNEKELHAFSLLVIEWHKNPVMVICFFFLFLQLATWLSNTGCQIGNLYCKFNLHVPSHHGNQKGHSLEHWCQPLIINSYHIIFQ